MADEGRKMAFALFAVALFLRPQISGVAYPFAEGIFCVLLFLALALLILRGGEEGGGGLGGGGGVGGGGWLAGGGGGWAPVLFLAWSLLSLAWSADRGQGAREAASLLAQGAAFVLAGVLVSEGSRFHRALGWLAGGVVLSAGLRVLHQRFWAWEQTRELARELAASGQGVAGIEGHLASGRAFGGFLNPNLLGGFAAMALPLFLGLAFVAPRGRRWPALCLAGAGAGILALSGSLGAILAALAAVVLLFALRGELGGKRVLALAAGGGVALTAVLAIRGTSFLWGIDGSLPQRIAYMSAGWRMGAESPLAGWGMGSVPNALAGFIPVDVRPVTDPHGFLFREWAAGGGVGLLLLLAALAWWGRPVARSLRRGDDPLLAALAASCAAFLLHSLVDMDFAVPETALFGWALMGAAMARGGGPCSGRPSAPSFPGSLKIGAGALLLALCLPLGAFIQGEVALLAGKESLREGRFPESLHWFRQAGSLLPFAGEADLGAGRALAGAGQVGPAEAAFGEARRKLPASPWPPWEMARLALRRGQAQDALGWIDRALTRFPSSPFLLIERGKILLGLGRREEARADLGRAVRAARLETGMREAAEALLAREGW